MLHAPCPFVTMKTKAILFLTLFGVMLQISGPSADNQSNNSYSSPCSPVQSTMTTSNDAPYNKPSHTSDQTQTVMMTEEKSDIEQKDIAPATSSPSYLSIGTSVQATEQPDQSSNSTTPLSPKTATHKFKLFMVLLAIPVLMLFVACLHAMRESAQDSSVPRLLLGVRQRLRAVIGNVEDRMGHRLWPGGKRENDDDEEEAERRQGDEGGQRVDDRGKEGSCGARNEKKGEHKEDDSDDSHDCSSIEEDNLRETVLSRQEEEERKQNGNEDEEDTSSESEGRPSNVEGESRGNEKRDSEDIALVNSVQEDEEEADLCDITVL
ncbi:uncharacterized protein LOC119022718 isoform X2 [Acanthopagrus latus]|uniref:uncharacterized protein LOC119022718 isoform X2 n=1 Tax=Acanthopagrus latus TaxID=8177 RepID=UPI00187C46B1|nr:uncharacterized protein LOC119022718 isoform X2 [Acanthopagrus latus]